MLFDIEINKKLPSFELKVTLQSNIQRLAILGPSGSGKSMTMQILAGLIQADHGHIRINGETWLDQNINLKTQQRKVGLTFQDYALFPHLTVAQNIGFGLQKNWFNPHKKISKEVQHWLDVMQLNQVAHHYPQQISGGQKQRTALARALIVKPKLLLLDEPFSALDVDLRQHTRKELALLQKENQIPMILITHDKVDADELADEIWLMHQGVLTKKS